MTTAYKSDNRERAEEESRKREARSLSQVDLSPVAIYLLDRDGNFISANPAGEELLGSSSREIAGTNIATTYLPEELLPGARRTSGDRVVPLRA